MQALPFDAVSDQNQTPVGPFLFDLFPDSEQPVDPFVAVCESADEKYDLLFGTNCRFFGRQQRIGNGCEFSGKSALVDLFARLAGVVDQLTLNLLVVLRAKGYEPIDAGQKRGVDSQVTSFKLVGEAIYGFAEEDEFEPSHEGRIRNLVTFSLPPVVDLPQGGAVQAENEPGVANRFAQSGEREALHALHDQHIDLFFDQGSLEKLYVFLPGFIERIGKYSGFECQPVLLAEQLLLQQGGVDQNTHAACMEEIGKVASDRFCPSAREGAVVKGDGSDLHDVCCCR